MKASLGFQGGLAAILMAFAVSSVSAPITGSTLGPECKLTDVTQDGADADACAGSYSGPRGGNPDLGELNGFTSDDWTGSDPNPLGGWIKGAKSDAGVFTTDAATGTGIGFDTNTGRWTVEVGSYAEFVLAFKQSTYRAYYYFENVTSSDGTYLLTWWKGGTTDLSNLTVFVRGTRQVPEPATLGLLGLGVVGLGFAARRRRKG